jgi:hypothetical protein
VKLADGLSPDQKKTIVDIFHEEGALYLGSLIADVDNVDKIFLIDRYNRYVFNSFENREHFVIYANFLNILQ